VNTSPRLTPVAAAVSALATLACCLPTGLATAAATAGLGVVLTTLRPWLLSLSVILVGVGLYQAYGTRRVCLKRNWISTSLLWLSATIVVLVILFPQLLAGVLADWLP
jgi:hypothetical protein